MLELGIQISESTANIVETISGRKGELSDKIISEIGVLELKMAEFISRSCDASVDDTDTKSVLQ